MQALYSRRKNLVYVLWTLCGYCSLNTFNPYKLLWPQCGYCIWGGKFHNIVYEVYANVAIWISSIHRCYCDPNVGIAFEKEISKECLWTLCKYYNLNIFIHIGYCDSNVGIVFEDGKFSVCFVNSMWVLHLRKKNIVCVLWTLCEYCIWEEKIWRVFCELYVGIAFEEKKSNVCFVNSMWLLQFVYLQSSGK
jgi:hypothetical protein